MAFNLTERFIRLIGHRLWLRYKGDSAIYHYRRRFERLWNSDRDQLQFARLESLRRILDHAGRTSTHYQTVFNERGFDPAMVKEFTDIRALPFLTKKDLNSRMDQVLSNSSDINQLTKSSTGGSSGEPLTFYRDRRATQVRRAQDLYFNSRIDVRPGVKRAWVWGSEIDAFSMRSSKARIMNLLTERAIYFYSFDATPESMRRFLLELNKHRPKAIFAYPNMLTALLEFARAESLALHPVPVVVTTAEPLYDFQRRLFGDVLRAHTFERYGSREFGTAAAEVETGGGLVLFEPCYHFEVVDPDGAPVPDGEMGELVITDFWNYAMPLIRYRTGDMVWLARSAGQATGWRSLSRIGGRVVDLLLRPDGSRIAGEAMIMLLRKAGFRSKVQVVQNAPDSLIVKYLDGESVAANIQADFQEKANDLFRARMKIEYLAIAKLNHDKSGKYRYVTREFE